MKVLLAFILGNIVGGVGMFFYLWLKGKVQNAGNRNV